MLAIKLNGKNGNEATMRKVKPNVTRAHEEQIKFHNFLVYLQDNLLPKYAVGEAISIA